MKDEIKPILDEYKKKGYIFENAVEIKSGKEATVYWVGNEKTGYALKVYKDPEQSL
jgi:serine/threonine-protein kinase RIO1